MSLESADPERIQSFVESCYQAVLNRSADAAALEAHRRLFSDRPLDEALRRTIQGLISSKEFARRWRTTPIDEFGDDGNFISTADVQLQMIVFNEEDMLQRSLPQISEVFPAVTVLDMGSTDRSRDVVMDLLKGRVEIVEYSRALLGKYGYAQARNFLGGFSRLPWIFALDADEIFGGVTDGRISLERPVSVTKVVTVERRNFRPMGWSFGDTITTSNSILSKIERKRRLYRPAVGQRWDGYIHEELYGPNIEAVSSHSNLLLNHYSSFRQTKKVEQRHLMYSWMLLKVFGSSELQKGVSKFWYEKYVVDNLDKIVEEAARFESAGGLGIMS